MVWVRIDNKSSPSFYVSCVYNPKADDENYYQCMLNNFENVLAKNKEIVILGDLNINYILDENLLVRAHLSKRGILKVCKAFLSRICHAVVFTQLGYADSKSAPCQALFLVFPFQNCKTKWPPK